MSVAFNLYHKLDYEGDEGLTWFKEEEFDDDPELQELFINAYSSYVDLRDDMDLLTNYLEKLDEISNPDS